MRFIGAVWCERKGTWNYEGENPTSSDLLYLPEGYRSARKPYVARIDNVPDPRRQASPLSPLTVIRLERKRGGSIEVWAKRVTLVSSGTFS